MVAVAATSPWAWPLASCPEIVSAANAPSMPIESVRICYRPPSATNHDGSSMGSSVQCTASIRGLDVGLSFGSFVSTAAR